ncbi:hypothetical protein AB2B38_002860 [Balneola sp. MJW-20]|uniref:hypothetical protein n=1 Tax=Gracilimonas aurantiaca TaxID=3234185 RepID=UPI00346613D4
MADRKSHSKSSNTFELTKWYLDCTTQEKQVVIYYAALLRWGKRKLHYNSLILSEQGQNTLQKSRFWKGILPDVHQDLIHLKDPVLRIDGHWRSATESFGTRLVDEEDGYLDWTCLQPDSDVNLNIAGKIYTGHGYSEKLIMTIPAWKINMKELRWGRFQSGTESMVWIDLDGSNKHLWINGTETSEFKCADGEIRDESAFYHLQMTPYRVIESEKKIETVVKKAGRFIPGFKDSIPSSFLQADATKWYSSGVLQKRNAQPIHGYVIHEFVNFNPME